MSPRPPGAGRHGRSADCRGFAPVRDDGGVGRAQADPVELAAHHHLGDLAGDPVLQASPRPGIRAREQAAELAAGRRILVAVEMLAAVPWGLGWMIFGARKFLNTDVMMAGIVVIAIIGLTLEKFVFRKIEDYTVVRWGMVAA